MLKDYIDSDLNTFFNVSEFAEKHRIDDKEIEIILDNDRLERRSKVEYEGIIVGDILYFAKEADFIKIPKPDATQMFNNTICTVFDVRKSNGVLEVILKKNVSG